MMLQNQLTMVRSMSDIADILSSNGGSLSSTSEPGSLRSLSASVPPSSCSSKLECMFAATMNYLSNTHKKCGHIENGVTHYYIP